MTRFPVSKGRRSSLGRACSWFGAFVLLLSGLAGIWTACSPHRLPAEFRRGMAAEEHGRLDEALRHYEHVFHSGKRLEDRAAAGIRRAGILRRMERFRKAVDAYLAVEAGPGRGTRDGARGMYRAAGILAGPLHQERRAMRVWKNVVARYPDTVSAEDALARIVAWYRGHDAVPALLSYLRATLRRSPDKAVTVHVLWESARIEQKVLHRPARAVRLYEQVYRLRPRGALADDAMIAAARTWRRLQRPDQALVWYKRLLGTKTASWIVGSYHSEWLDDALFELGQTYLDDLGRIGRAKDAFRKLVKDFPDSVLRDDALWWVCLCDLRQGHAAWARKALANLVRRFPESRFRLEAKALDDWAPVAQTLAGRNAHQICAALGEHAKLHPFSWFRKRRKVLSKRFGCTQP
ncbi:MAG: tetratricopeptide repeat protein [Deltaproteobacteria bacterium]|nr:tetratricopeptide repeat protein [Deltaproteobacteria bacterium]